VWKLRKAMDTATQRTVIPATREVETRGPKFNVSLSNQHETIPEKNNLKKKKKGLVSGSNSGSSVQMSVP
jgi:hypothetical protein